MTESTGRRRNRFYFAARIFEAVYGRSPLPEQPSLFDWDARSRMGRCEFRPPDHIINPDRVDVDLAQYERDPLLTDLIAVSGRVNSVYAAFVDLVRDELADDPTVDITTTGRQTGLPRRLEIWMLDVDGRFFITGTPGERDWMANLTAEPSLVVHLKRHAHIDLTARAIPVSDPATRRAVLEHLNAAWYRTQEPLDNLVATSPMVEVVFDGTLA